MNCEACGTKRNRKQVAGAATLYACPVCGALTGSCYRGDVYRHVALHLPMAAQAEGKETYFDLTIVGSTVSRVHGWFDSATRRVVQFG